jgi:hypothetical protein
VTSDAPGAGSVGRPRCNCDHVAKVVNMWTEFKTASGFFKHGDESSASEEAGRTALTC